MGRVYIAFWPELAATVLQICKKCCFRLLPFRLSSSWALGGCVCPGMCVHMTLKIWGSHDQALVHGGEACACMHGIGDFRLLHLWSGELYRQSCGSQLLSISINPLRLLTCPAEVPGEKEVCSSHFAERKAQTGISVIDKGHKVSLAEPGLETSSW